MKKYIAFLLCLMMIVSLFSCNVKDNNDDIPSNDDNETTDTGHEVPPTSDCAYPITAEQAWDLANAYWDHQDGRTDCAAGTVFTARIVLIDTPDSDTNEYRFAFQVESTSNGGGEGDECKPPYHVNSYDQILVDAFTGKIMASTYDPNGKSVSVEEAIEIAKKDCEYIDFDKEEKEYRVEHGRNVTAPDHVYVIVIQRLVIDHYSTVTEVWVDKYTGEPIFPYYVYGK